MKKSINEIRLELKAIADAHLQVNDYAWKDFLRAYTENDLNYPLMCAYYPSGNIYMNQTQIQLNIVICDRIEKDWNKNLNEVESDTLQICRDIFNVLNESSRWQRIGRVSNCVVNKFVERSGDEVAGHTMQIDFLIRDNSGVCDLPMEDYNFDQAISQGCPSVDIFNSDLSYTAEVASGDSLELPDIDYAVKNSLGTTLAGATVPSVSNIETTLNDVDNIDSDGSTVPTPAGVPFTCTPNAPCDDALVTINTNYASIAVPSGDTINIDVKDQDFNPIVPIGFGGSFPNYILEISAQSVPCGAKILRTGQTASSGTRSDGDLQNGRGTSFFLLPTIGGVQKYNPWGHTQRFTGTTGGYYDEVLAGYYDSAGVATTRALALPNEIVIDWSDFDGATVIGAYVNVPGFVYRSFADNLTYCNSFTIGSYVSGWYSPNKKEVENFQYCGSSGMFDYGALNLTGFISIWSSTEVVNDPLRGYLFYSDGRTLTNTKTSSAGGSMPCRQFTVTGTTLT